jgi:ankyrin repeat protein
MNIAQVLLSARADPNLTNLVDMTAADVASQAGHVAVEQLLEKRSDPSRGHHRKKNALILDVFDAVRRGDIEQFKAIVEGGKVDVNKRDEDGATCLM